MAKKILIVEDDKPTFDALRHKCSEEDFEIYHARNGEEGLRMATEMHPDLILLDVVMPVMDGVTMLRKLREDEWGRDAKVIMLTNLADSNEVIKLAKEDVFDYLIKSNWKIEDVLKKIKEELK